MRSARGAAGARGAGARVAAVALAGALLAALALGAGALLLSAGWGAALRSVADRVLPYPEVTMWAGAPAPGSHVDSYADATGAGENYVYLVDAADAEGNVRELQLIFFGRESDGEGWLEVEARGGSGVRYAPCEGADVPAAALEALLGRPSSGPSEAGARRPASIITASSGGATWRGYWR